MKLHNERLSLPDLRLRAISLATQCETTTNFGATKPAWHQPPRQQSLTLRQLADLKRCSLHPIERGMRLVSTPLSSCWLAAHQAVRLDALANEFANGFVHGFVN